MNCLEMKRELTESTSYSQLSRAAQKHLDHCVECQGAYPTRPALKSLLLDAWPEMEPDPRLLATVRQSVYEQMNRPAWGFLQLDFFPSLSFAAGVAALVAVLGLPLLWMGGSAPQGGRGFEAVAQAERVQVQAELVGFNSTGNPLVADPITSLQRVYRPQIQPGSVVHVIYPFSKKKQQQQRAVIHY